MSAMFNLFMRNWLNRRASEEDIDLAVNKGLLTEQQGQEIKDTPR